MKCPHCNEDIDHVVDSANVALKDGKLYWDEPRYSCPKCKHDLDIEDELALYHFLRGMEKTPWVYCIGYMEDD